MKPQDFWPLFTRGSAGILLQLLALDHILLNHRTFYGVDVACYLYGAYIAWSNIARIIKALRQ